MDIYDPKPLVTAYTKAGADEMLAVVMAATYNPFTDTHRLSEREKSPKIGVYDYAAMAFMLLLRGDAEEAKTHIEIAACRVLVN